MRDRGIGVLLLILVLGACTGKGVSTASSPTQPAGPSAVQPAIDDLVDVQGEPIDVSSLQGRIVFSSGTEDIYTVNADGSGLKRLTTSQDLEFDPTWSPDGTAIAYRHQSGDDATTDIFTMDANGSHSQNLTGRDGLGDWGPDWSPDGEWITWNTASAGFIFDLGVIHPDGTSRRVVKPGVYVEYPAWSPDGRRIAFMSPGEGSQYDIFVMNADGTDVRRLTESATDDGWAAWSPDGRQIVFSSVRDGHLLRGRGLPHHRRHRPLAHAVRDERGWHRPTPPEPDVRAVRRVVSRRAVHPVRAVAECDPTRWHRAGPHPGRRDVR
jgi:dipeptidyl aminopeptidase/acylaminoacyl peptidase